MRIWILSDRHIGADGMELEIPEADVCVCAGTVPSVCDFAAAAMVARSSSVGSGTAVFADSISTSDA